jgi:hypothetical protein
VKSQESQPDRNRRSDQYDDLWKGWVEFWETRSGIALAAGIVAAVSGALLFGQLGNLGIWEPWEANEILVAQEYQDRGPPPSEEELDPKDPSYNWAVPTKDSKPIARSLLKVWLVAATLPGSAVDSGQPQVGLLEFSARFPFALGALILALVGFFWLRDVFDTWSALLASLAVVSAPAVFVGVHTISAATLFVVTTSLAVIAFGKLVFAAGPFRYLWGLCFGVGLALSFLDQRFFGLLVPLTAITAFGLTQLPYLQATDIATDDPPVGLLQRGLAVAALLAGGAFAAWGFWISAQVPGQQLLLPYIKQLFAVFLPLFVLLSGLFLAWRTRVVRALRSPAGLIGLAVAGAAAFWVLEAYADANPTLLKNGEIVGTIPVLEFALQNDLYGAGPSGNHPHFAMWFRQIGFSMVPWAAFVPLGLGYLADATRLTDDTGAIRESIASERDSIRRLLLVWSFTGVVVVAGASVYGHYYVPVYFPLLTSIGLMFGDAPFWRRARLDSLLQYFMGFAAIAVLMMLAKDLERFPPRLLEPFLMFEKELGLPDDFAYGALLDRLKYTWVVVSAVFFFGIASRALHEKYRDVALPLLYAGMLGGLPYLWESAWGVGPLVVHLPRLSELASGSGTAALAVQVSWIGLAVALPAYLAYADREGRDDYLARWNVIGWGAGLSIAFALAVQAFARGAQSFAAGALLERFAEAPKGMLSLLLFLALLGGTVYYAGRHLDIVVEWFGRRWSNLAELFSDEGSPARERAREKERLRRESSVYGVVARVLETPRTFGAILLVLFVGTAGIFLYSVLPELGHHLSQRGIFETYTQVREEGTKLYRFRVSTRETSVYLRDVPELDSTSEFLDKFGSSERFFAVIPRDQLSGLNAQIRNEHDRDIPVLDARSSQILLVSNQLREGETDENFIAEAIVADRSEIQHEVTFAHNGRQKHPVFDNRIKLLGYSLDKPGEKPAYSWGSTAVLSTYFEVLRPLPTNQQIFLHVDYPGSRIHGDHYPMGGDFPTSDWPQGQIVKDVYELQIDTYASTGDYTVNFGFYRSGSRMSVQPDSAHDGQNRVPMGQIEVTGF